MQRRRSWLIWLAGAVMTAVTLALLMRASNLRFENSDDALILKAFMGFEGGVPADFSMNMHPLLAGALHALALCNPAVPWFSLFQVGLLLLSATVLVKAGFQLARGQQFPWLAGLAAGCVTLSVCVAFVLCRVNHTTTAALAGAAAVAQALSVTTAHTRGQAVRGMLLCLLLAAAAYLLRLESVWPALALILLVFGWQVLYQPGDKTPHARGTALVGTLTLVCVVAALVGTRLWVVQARGLQADQDWHAARIALMDYTDFETDPAPALAASGPLDATEIELARRWFFMDAAMTTEALQTLADAYADEPAPAPVTRLADFLRDNPRQLYTLAITALLCALCWLGERRTHPGAALAATLALAAALVFLFYLALRGRLLARAADAVLLPAFALTLGLALLKPPKRGLLRRGLAALLLLGVLLGTGLQARQTRYEITRAPDTVSLQREAALEQFALQNPDLLIARSPNLLRDTRLLPDVSAGVPGNLILWGDWACHTPGWYAQLARYGLDGHALRAQDWLGTPLVLASADPAETDALCAWLSQALGMPVAAEPLAQADEFTVYRMAAAH